MNPRLIFAGLAVLLTLSGCSNSADSSEAKTETTPSPSLAALPLSGHVITELAGFKGGNVPVVQDVAAFAKAHEKTVAELNEIGLVNGVTVKFAPDSQAPGNALSVAEQFGTAEQAVTEANRLFTANSEPEDGATVSPLAVPGIPGAKAITMTGAFDGNPFTSVEIVFVDATVVHELFVIGGGSAVSVPDMVAAATELYDAIKGRSLA